MWRASAAPRPVAGLDQSCQGDDQLAAWRRPSRERPTLMRRFLIGTAVVAIGMLVTGAAVLTTGCGPSPTGPDDNTHMRGQVVDRIFRPLAGALIEVVDGPHAGMRQLADAAGRFELRGSAGDRSTVRVSRDGFHTRTQVLETTNQPFWLDALEPSIGLEPGGYTLTLTIDLAKASNWIAQAPCAGFPAELASRTYPVTIAEASFPLAVYNRLVNPDPPIAPWHNLFPQTLFGFGAVERFVGFEWDDPLFEELPGFRYVRIGGKAPTTEPASVNGSSVSVPFHGDFSYCRTKSFTSRDCWHERADEIVEFHACSSDHAAMVFTKR